jgi:putative DNA primase/helicase
MTEFSRNGMPELDEAYSRDDSLYRRGASYKGRGLTNEEMAEELRKENQLFNNPMSHAQVEKIIRSASKVERTVPFNQNNNSETNETKEKIQYKEPKSTSTKTYTHVEDYVYTDELGNYMFAKARSKVVDHDTGEVGKSIYYKEKLDHLNEEQKATLYNRVGIKKAIEEGKPVYIVEGEKDANTLIKAGLTATCSKSSSEKIKDYHKKQLEGVKSIYLIPDKDKAGMTSAYKWFNAIKDVVDNVKVLNWNDEDIKADPESKEFAKWDITDQVEACNYTDEELLNFIENNSFEEFPQKYLDLIGPITPEVNIDRILKDPRVSASRNTTIEALIDRFVKKNIGLKSKDVNPKLVYLDLLNYINSYLSALKTYYKGTDKSNMHKTIDKLPIESMAYFLTKLFIFKAVAVNGDKDSIGSTPVLNDILCIYADDISINFGVPESLRGLYVQNIDILKRLITKFNIYTKKDLNDMLDMIYNSSERVATTRNPDLIATNNGIFNYKKKKLLDFRPRYVYLGKLDTDYNPNAKNIVIEEHGEKWDIESWISDLFDDIEEEVLAMWQIIGMMIRSDVRIDKVFLFYNETGNNGKGTVCQLIRGIIGSDNCASTSIDDFNKDFGLEDLVGKKAVITDENDVSAFHKKMSNFKSAVSRDPIKIDRKYLKAISYVFQGNMIQCINGLPNTRDTSPSLTRRFYFVIFRKRFKVGSKPWIKDDYINRKEVREYVLYKVLTLLEDHYNVIETKSAKETSDQYDEENDITLKFWNEVKYELAWDVVPFDLLFGIYTGWYNEEKNGSVTIKSNYNVGKTKFKNKIISYIENDPDSEWMVERGKKYRISDVSDTPKPLVYEYNVIDWMNDVYKGDDPLRYSIVNNKKATGRYLGIYKKSYYEDDSRPTE